MNKMLRVAVGSDGGGGGGGATWNLLDATYNGVNFDVSGEVWRPSGLAFKPDGTKMYVIGKEEARVYQYTLSTTWDVDTASYDDVSFRVRVQEQVPEALAFKPDGTKMYVIGKEDARLYQYTLSTEWDLSTASYDSVYGAFLGQIFWPTGVSFKYDGTEIYIIDAITGGVHQWPLSTAWDITSESTTNTFFSMATEDAFLQDILVTPDGTKMYMMGRSTLAVYQYDMSTPWDVSTASYDDVSFDVSDETTLRPRALAFRPDGFRMYTVGSVTKTVFQYSVA